MLAAFTLAVTVAPLLAASVAIMVRHSAGRLRAALILHRIASYIAVNYCIRCHDPSRPASGRRVSQSKSSLPQARVARSARTPLTRRRLRDGHALVLANEAVNKQHMHIPCATVALVRQLQPRSRTCVVERRCPLLGPLRIQPPQLGQRSFVVIHTQIHAAVRLAMRRHLH